MPKLLFTSDLHLHRETVDGVLCAVRDRLKACNPDALVVAGDVSDMPSQNTFGFLGEFDLPVVFCLGNHEFAYSSVQETLAKTRHDFELAQSCGVRNVHCLDIEGHFDALGIRFYGNVLWYDGSLYNGGDAAPLLERIDPRWLDCAIEGFKPLEEHRRCVEQIKRAQHYARGRRLVLVTHCVPHRRLNQFDADTPMSVFNCYSGVADLFGGKNIHPDLALCGHTHRRAMYGHRMKDGREIRCINSGNDYFFKTGEVIFDEIEI